MMLPISEGDFSCSRPIDGKVCIGDTLLRKYTPKYIKPASNRNRIACGCKTCIIAMLIQPDLNKWRILKLEKLDKLYINSASNRLLQISKNNFIEDKNKIFPNISHIHLIA